MQFSFHVQVYIGKIVLNINFALKHLDSMVRSIWGRTTQDLKQSRGVLVQMKIGKKYVKIL